MSKSPVIIALDCHDLPSVLAFAEQLDPTLCRLKVGKELFTSCGVIVVKALQDMGFELFLDLKFHDIPNTTKQAVLAAADLGVWMTNIHASVGIEAMALCQNALQVRGYATKLIAVTVLTSMSDENLLQLGINRTVEQQVLHLATMTKDAGLYGVVCSANEATMLKTLGGLKLISPGIRMSEDATHDQQRICTPKNAIDNGVDYLVIGRSITEDSNPNDKLLKILASLKA